MGFKSKKVSEMDVKLLNCKEIENLDKYEKIHYFLH